jgi:hypothetical protein
MAVMLLSDFVTRHSMPLQRTSLLHDGILCRCSGLRNTAFHTAAADFVAARRHSMPLQRTSLLHDGIECRCSGLRNTATLRSCRGTS